MDLASRPDAAARISHPPPPAPPFDVVVVGAGRVGRAYAAALERAGHRIVALLGRTDDPSAIATADLIVLTVPDDALTEVAALAGRLGRSGAIVVHTSGALGLAAVAAAGPHVAAIHPACTVASPEQRFNGVVFGVTCPDHLRPTCEQLCADLGGTPTFIDEADRPRYHAALAIASNFPVALAGDAADLLGGHQALVPLLRAMVENIAALGPDAALTGPIVRGDVQTVRAHLAALPPSLLPMYIENARRTIARALGADRITDDQATALNALLQEHDR